MAQTSVDPVPVLSTGDGSICAGYGLGGGRRLSDGCVPEELQGEALAIYLQGAQDGTLRGEHEIVLTGSSQESMLQTGRGSWETPCRG